MEKSLMKNFKRGGIETIVGVVILVGIVVLLLVTIVLPMVVTTNTAGEEAGDNLGVLGAAVVVPGP